MPVKIEKFMDPKMDIPWNCVIEEDLGPPAVLTVSHLMEEVPGMFWEYS